MIKKGCLGFIVITVFVIGVGYHLWQRYGEQLKEEAKNRIVELAIENLNEKIAEYNPEVESDSLATLISEFVKKKSADINLDGLSEYLDNLSQDIEDKININGDEILNYMKLEEIMKNEE